MEVVVLALVLTGLIGVVVCTILSGGSGNLAGPPQEEGKLPTDTLLLPVLVPLRPLEGSFRRSHSQECVRDHVSPRRRRFGTVPFLPHAVGLPLCYVDC